MIPIILAVIVEMSVLNDPNSPLAFWSLAHPLHSARGDELMTAGLDVPQVTRVAMALRDKGIAINPAVYTVDELSKELVALKRGGGKKC